MGNQFATCADCGNGELQYWLDNTNVTANPGDLCLVDTLPNCTDVTSPGTAGSDVFCANPYLEGQCGLEDYRELAIPNCPDNNRTVYKVVAPDVPDPSVCSTSCAGSPYEDDNIFFYPDACCCELDVEDNLPLCSAVNSSHVDGCCRNDNITTLECGLVDVTNSYLTDYPLVTYEGGNCVNGPLSNTIPQDYYDVFRIGGCPTPTPTSAPTCKDDVVCKPGVCFAAIPGDECPDGTWALHDYLFKVHPHCTPDVPVGHLCEGSGECGTNQDLNNCKALEYHMFNIATDLYRRVECCDGDAPGWGTDGWTSDGWLRRGN